MKTITMMKWIACITACSLVVGVQAQSVPPKKGEPIDFGPGWHSERAATGEKAVPVFISTDDPQEGYVSPPKSPNNFKEGDELKAWKPDGPVHVDGADRPDQGEYGTQANTLLVGFDTNGTGLNPPDPAMAVGDEYVVTLVNSNWSIYDKCGNALFNTTIQDFLNRPGAFIFDPKVMFDPWRRRWIQLWHERTDATQDTRLLVVVSDDDNPFGNWWYYSFNAETETGGANAAWADYYDLGYSSAALYAAGNQFRWAGGFRCSTFRTWDPAQIYSAAVASMITDLRFTNPDGSTTHTPRCVRGLNGGANYFVAARTRTGGSRITLFSIADPLGAHTISANDINVAAYTLPPSADQPSGAGTLDTIDNRLMPAYFLSQGGTPRIFTSLNCDHPSSAGTVSTRLYILNPSTLTAELDWNFWSTSTDTWFGCPAVNYGETCNWVFTRSSSTLFPTARYVDWSAAGGFSNSSAQLRAGTASYGGFRWGDYFQGDLDWGDYYQGGGTAGNQKMWFIGEYGESGWGTAVGATLSSGVTPGSVSVAPNSGALFTGFEGGPFSPASVDYTVSNPGQVGVNWDVSSSPAYVNVSPSSGQLFAGDSVVSSVSPNAAMEALTYGVYNSSVVYRNCYNGSTASRAVRVIVSAFAFPRSFTVRLGRQTAGNLASLQSVDAVVLRVCRFIVPNNLVDPVNVEVNSTAPGASASEMFVVDRSKMGNAGSFAERMEMFDYNLNNWSPVDFTDNAINTSFAVHFIAASGNPTRYIRASDRNMLMRYRIRQTGPSAVVQWCHDQDIVYWQMTP